jgi:hypothetical protein
MATVDSSDRSFGFHKTTEIFLCRFKGERGSLCACCLCFDRCNLGRLKLHLTTLNCFKLPIKAEIKPEGSTHPHSSLDDFLKLNEIHLQRMTCACEWLSVWVIVKFRDQSIQECTSASLIRDSLSASFLRSKTTWAFFSAIISSSFAFRLVWHNSKVGGHSVSLRCEIDD